MAIKTLADKIVKRMRSWPGADRDGGYGWISIALHWITAAIIFVLLFTGDSVRSVGPEMHELHTTIAAIAYPLLALRILWRVFAGHPSVQTQKRWSFVIGLVIHYAMLVGIVIMLLSGPVVALSSALGLHVGSLQFRIVAWAPLYGPALAVHRVGALALFWGIALHICAVLKHIFVDQDRTIDRILMPPRRRASKLFHASPHE